MILPLFIEWKYEKKTLKLKTLNFTSKELIMIETTGSNFQYWYIQHNKLDNTNVHMYAHN